MPAISFSTMKDKILNKSKKQTIRPRLSDWWLRWEEGDCLVGFWKMRTKECEKLFDSEFSEDPSIVKWKEFTDELMIRDGFESLDDANFNWFLKKYGLRGGPAKPYPVFWFIDPWKEFVVIRWK